MTDDTTQEYKTSTSLLYICFVALDDIHRVVRTLCTNSTSDGASDGNGSGKCFRCTVSDVNSDETRWGSKDLEGWNPTENLHSLYSNSPYPCCSAQYRLSKDLEGWNSKHVPLLQHMTPAWASPMRPGTGSWKETDRRPDGQCISLNPQTIPTRRCDPTWGNTSIYFSLLLAAVLRGRGRV